MLLLVCVLVLTHTSGKSCFDLLLSSRVCSPTMWRLCQSAFASAHAGSGFSRVFKRGSGLFLEPGIPVWVVRVNVPKGHSQMIPRLRIAVGSKSVGSGHSTF